MARGPSRAQDARRAERRAGLPSSFTPVFYVNWNSKTIGPHQRQWRPLSQGIARAKAPQAAAGYGRDPALKNSHVANNGSVVSIASGQGSERGGWVLVTSERTTGQGDYAGLPATAHVAYARVVHTRSGWVISQWSPQS